MNVQEYLFNVIYFKQIKNRFISSKNPQQRNGYKIRRGERKAKPSQVAALIHLR
jgi:hypothetical protein